MSEENIELMRRSVEAFERRDRTAWLAIMDEDLEVVPPRDWPESGVRGAEAAWDLYLDVFDAFSRVPVDDIEIVAAQADKVVARYRFDVSGRASGAGVEFDYWLVSTVREGRFTRGQWFAKRAEALEAAGLAE